MADANEKWFWWASADEERYQGPYDTREEAIEVATEDELGWDEDTRTCNFHIMEACQRNLTIDQAIDIEDSLERALDGKWSEQGDPEGDYLLFGSVTIEQWADLKARIAQACAEWHAAHNIVQHSWTFHSSRHGEQITTHHPKEDEDAIEARAALTQPNP